MNSSLLFTSGLVATLAVSAVVVVYLRRPLEKLLVELCGNQNRAEFWTAFSAVTVGLVPVIFALSCPPSVNPAAPALLEVAEQVKWGFIGMALSVLMLGWVIGRFIPRAGAKP